MHTRLPSCLSQASKTLTMRKQTAESLTEYTSTVVVDHQAVASVSSLRCEASLTDVARKQGGSTRVCQQE